MPCLAGTSNLKYLGKTVKKVKNKFFLNEIDFFGKRFHNINYSSVKLIT